MASQALEDSKAMDMVGDVLTMLAFAIHVHQETGANAGKLKCCRCEGTVNWVRAPSNGHIHGACETPGCVGWMQ